MVKLVFKLKGRLYLSFRNMHEGPYTAKCSEKLANITDWDAYRDIHIHISGKSSNRIAQGVPHTCVAGKNKAIDFGKVFGNTFYSSVGFDQHDFVFTSNFS